LAAGLLTAPAAVSASAHFVGSPSIAVNNGGVTATGKIAGLGNQDVTINLEATVKVTCRNRGGHVPPGQTQTLTGAVSNLSPKNGSVNFSVSTNSVGDTCPGPMTPTLTLERATLTGFQGGQQVMQRSFA